MPARPCVRLTTTATALCAVLLSGCAAGADDASSASAPSAPPTSTAASPAASPPAGASPPATPASSAAPSPTVRTIDVAYAGGEVTGTSGREEVTVGEQVVLRVSSDVAEEVHVHGYDLEQAVPAGATVEIPVRATIPGVFEVEMHQSHKVLFQLRVA